MTRFYSGQLTRFLPSGDINETSSLSSPVMTGETGSAKVNWFLLFTDAEVKSKVPIQGHSSRN